MVADGRRDAHRELVTILLVQRTSVKNRIMATHLHCIIRTLGLGALASSFLLVSMTACADEPPRSDADLSGFVEFIWFFPKRVGTAVMTGVTYAITAPVHHLAGTEPEAYDDLVVRPLAALEEGTGR